MNLSREQLLAEMGISPQWKLREQPSVGREANKVVVSALPVEAPAALDPMMRPSNVIEAPAPFASAVQSQRLDR